MTFWPLELDPSGTRYEAIAEAIAAAVASGTLAPGDRLPPQRELAHRLGVTVGTVGRAYSLAEQRGLVRGEVGRGTFVRDRNGGGEALVPPAPRAGVDLGMNMPLAAANADALAATLAEIAASDGMLNLLRYMPTEGHAAHRAAAAGWIARSGFAPEAGNVVLTEGAQQALAATFEVLVTPGEPVLVESYTYSGLLENARLKRVPLAPVAIDDEGMRPDALEQQARATKAKIAIVVPTIHNPTAAVMSEQRRRDLAAVAERCELTLVEDDVYGYLCDERPAPIAAWLPKRTIYVTSASKCLAPGLRVGWLAAPPALVKPFADLVYAQSVAQPALNHEILRRWIEDGTAARLVRELAAETAARQALALEMLEGFDTLSHPASFHLLLELPAPWQRDDFVAAALDRGVRVSSVGAFAVEPAKAGEAVRLSLVGAVNRAELQSALTELRDLLARGPEARRAVV